MLLFIIIYAIAIAQLFQYIIAFFTAYVQCSKHVEEPTQGCQMLVAARLAIKVVLAKVKVGMVAMNIIITCIPTSKLMYCNICKEDTVTKLSFISAQNLRLNRSPNIPILMAKCGRPRIILV